MNKKDIIKFIEKAGQVMSPDDVEKMPSKPAPATMPSNKGTSGTFTSAVSEVKNMQLAMQNLAYAVVRDANASTIVNKPKSQQSATSTGYQQQSKDAFNDFIAEQYIGSLPDDKKGVQWDKSPGVVTQSGKTKTQKEVNEMDAVMDTMYRTGPASNEFKPDGVWGWRTANALKNMLGFVWALLHVQGDFGLENKEYTLENWNDFDKLLDYNINGTKVELSPEEQKVRAPKITAHLKKITLLYNDFRKKILAKPAFKKLIDGVKSFDSYNKEKITDKEKTFAQGSYAVVPIKFTVNNKQITQFPLKALTNKDEYLKYMKSLGASTEDAAIEIYNNYIKPQISAL